MTARRRGNGEGTAPRRRADGRWQVNIRWTDDHGVNRRTTVYGKTQRETRERAKTVRERVAKGRPAQDRKVTVERFAEEWIGSALAASDRKPTTKTMYAGMARKHVIGSTLGALELGKIRPRHVEAWVVELRGKGLAESTVRSAYTILRAVLDTAVRDGALGENPATAVRRPRVSPKEAAYLTPDQVRDLLVAATATRFSALFELLVNTGLRRGEALALRWPDVDFESKVLRVRGTLSRVGGELVVTETKTEKSKRVLSMTPAVERTLRKVRSTQREERLRAGSVWVHTGFVFTTELGTPADPRNALRALKTAARRAGLPCDVGLHTLRHSAASVMLVNGVPLKVVSEILGHSSISITGDIYGHVSPDIARHALDGLAAALQ